MPILTLPSIPPASIDWQLLTVSESFASPFTGSEQTAGMPGSARIVATLTWKLTRVESFDLEAFLWECDGPAGRFYLGIHPRATPRGNPLGVPVVDGAANSGGSLASRGWTPNAAGVLLRGDYIGVNNELKMLRADANADADGKLTLSIKPNLRTVPADGTPIVTAAPKGIFRLLDDNQVKFAYRKQTGDYQVTAVETWS